MHAIQECFSLPIDSSINKQTNYHNTTAKCLLVSFFWALFLRLVRYPWVLGCPLNATGWLLQAAILLEIAIWLVHDVGHGFIYILGHYECNEALFEAISPWKSLSLALTYNPPLHVQSKLQSCIFNPSWDITLWRNELHISQYLSLSVIGRFPISVTCLRISDTKVSRELDIH